MDLLLYFIDFLVLIICLLVAINPTLEKWAKDSRREEKEAQNKFNQYEDDWIKIHRD